MELLQYCFVFFWAILVASLGQYHRQMMLLQPDLSNGSSGYSSCEKVLENIAHGPEDFVYSRRFSLIIISSHNRRDEASLGTLLFLNATTGLQISNIKIEVPPEFRPHGMAIFEDEETTTTTTRFRLFVVSHRGGYVRNFGGGNTIEVFDYLQDSLADGAKLIHSYTLESNEGHLVAPNDLIAVGYNEVIVSNDHCVSSKLLWFIHDFINYSCSEMSYWNGYKWATVGNKPVLFGNGLIKMDKYLIRAAAASYSLYNFSILQDEDNLKLDVVSIDNLLFSPDNIEHDSPNFSDGVIIAGHLSVYRFMLHFIFGWNSPSVVILYHGPNRFTPLYYSTGANDNSDNNENNKRNGVSGSSVAVRTDDGTLYIGQVFDPFILRCTNVNVLTTK